MIRICSFASSADYDTEGFKPRGAGSPSGSCYLSFRCGFSVDDYWKCFIVRVVCGMKPYSFKTLKVLCYLSGEENVLIALPMCVKTLPCTGLFLTDTAIVNTVEDFLVHLILCIIIISSSSGIWQCSQIWQMEWEHAELMGRVFHFFHSTLCDGVKPASDWVITYNTPVSTGDCVWRKHVLSVFAVFSI